MGNLLAYKRALRGLHSYGPNEIWIAPFTITGKASLRVFRNKVEITLPLNGSNKLLTILHYSVPLFFFSPLGIVLQPCSQANLNVWFILFVMVNLKFFSSTTKRRNPNERFYYMQWKLGQQQGRQWKTDWLTECLKLTGCLAGWLAGWLTTNCMRVWNLQDRNLMDDTVKFFTI